MLQHNHWGNDGWVPFAKYWDPGPRIGVHRMSQWSTDKSVRIHYSLLQCYYLPVNVRCLRDSLSVTDSGSHSGTPFQAPVVDFCVTKFT